MDLHLSISDGFVKTKIYDKRDDFDIVNFPFLRGDVPHSTFYGVYILNLFDLLECPVMLLTLICVIVIRFWQQNFSDKDYRYHNINRALSKLYRRHFNIVSKYNVGLKTLLLQGL